MLAASVPAATCRCEKVSKRLSTQITLPGEPQVTLEMNVPCVMRDGVTLMNDVYRPAGDGPFPVLLIRLPYDKTSAEFGIYNHPSWFARHGYLVVAQDCRGRHQSEGEWYPFRYEANDGYDAVEWAAKLPGANGKVGMYGASYAGATQLLAAVNRPPSLATIIPAVTSSQYYDGWTYKGGALSLAFIASWATQLAENTAARAGDLAEVRRLQNDFNAAASLNGYLPFAEYPPLAGDWAPYFHDWLAHPTYDDYWRQWSIDEDYSRVDVPALHLAGWYDVFLNGSVKNFTGIKRDGGSAGTKSNQKLLIGPWVHLPWLPADGSLDPAAGPVATDEWHLRWFDHFLKGEATGVLDAPVTVYVMGENRWRDFADWPPPETTPTNYYLHGEGRANTMLGDGRLSLDQPGDEPADTFLYEPANPARSTGGHSCCFHHVAPMGPADQYDREMWPSVLAYTTEPLAEDMYLVGDVAVTLHAATSAVDTDWTARLCRVDASGTSTNLAEGIIRARYRDSLSEPSLLEPNRVYEYTIDLGPVGARIAAGERIRLTVSSSDFPQWDRNLNTGGPLFKEAITAAKSALQTVFHDALRPSHVTLPVLTKV